MQIDTGREELAHRHFANPVLVQDVKNILGLDEAGDKAADGEGLRGRKFKRKDL